MNKRIEVRYFSRTGNTTKLAARIAAAAGCEAKTVDAPINKPIDILFLGASVYAAGIDNKVKEFINSLSKYNVGKIVVFSTSALVERGYPEIKKAILDKGIPVEEDNYYCRGQFTLLHRGRPNDKDLLEAEEFTKRILKEQESR